MGSLVAYMNEGTSSPFIARLFSSLLTMRDQLFLLGKEDKESISLKFDKQFHPMFEAALSSRDAAQSIINLIADHSNDINAGKVVEFTRGLNFTIRKTIDVPLGQAVDLLINQSGIAIKSCLQTMLREFFDLDIGFLFQKDAIYENGLSVFRLKEGDVIADYLNMNRTIWLSEFLKLRNMHEHEGWTLETIRYFSVEPGKFVVKIPEVNGVSVSKFAKQTGNRVLLFIENLMVYGMEKSKYEPLPIYVSEIPEEKRDPENLERFRLAAAGLQNLPKWIISFEDNDDFL